MFVNLKHDYKYFNHNFFHIPFIYKYIYYKLYKII